MSFLCYTTTQPTQMERMDAGDDGNISEITNYVADIRNNTFIPTDMSNYNDTQQFTSSTSMKKIAYLIVDTNFILSNLSLLQDLEKLLHATYMGMYHIIIPKQVIHELDGLKDANKSIVNSQHSISTLARFAIDWCYAHFHDSIPTVSGQRLNERIDKNATKDNSILDCCLYFKNVENYGNNLVILLSNDKNLCVKALVNNLLTISYRNGMTADLIASNIVSELQDEMEYRQQNQQQPYQGQYSDQNSIEYDNTIGEPQEITQQVPGQSTSAAITTNDSFHPVSNEIYGQVTTLVLESINYAIVSIYEDDIFMVDYDESKMNSLKDAGKCIVRLGFSIFEDFFDKKKSSFNPMNILKDSVEFNKFVNIPLTIDDLKEFVTFWSDFLDGIYKNRNIVQKDALLKIEKNWKNRIDGINDGN